MASKFTTDVQDQSTGHPSGVGAVHLSDDEKHLLQHLCEFLTETASTYGIPGATLTWFELFDPEGGPDQVVVVQTLPVDAETATAYWDVEASQFTSWRISLAKSDRQLLDDRFAVNIQWTVDG